MLDLVLLCLSLFLRRVEQVYLESGVNFVLSLYFYVGIHYSSRMWFFRVSQVETEKNTKERFGSRKKSSIDYRFHRVRKIFFL